ncbi:MAG: PhoX family phosphatase [Tetrasphaera jenkinsii]|jgi:secreted PhoX family phosphatase|nr:PhoX family phosphatase [Tetrasphaera jenkinsii]
MTIPLRRDLPMAGLTHGKRSPLTCALRCGNQCAHAAPNPTSNPTFRDIAASALSRRAALTGASGLSLSLLAAPAMASEDERTAPPLAFATIAPVAAEVDDVTVPRGYRWDAILRWGDPLFTGVPNLTASGTTAADQAKQFGYNCDYLDIIVDKGSTTKAVLVANHEYTNENIMFPPDTDAETIARTAWAAHGLSVVELRRSAAGKPWRYVVGGRRNRRITLDSTTFAVDGPAAGSTLLQTPADPTGKAVIGTMNNCSGGTTPWGTVLSGEENFHQYFYAAGTTPQEARYGLGTSGDSRRWRDFDQRWDATSAAGANEPNRFGWIVEVDPQNPTSTPVKHTAMGRLKHEGANVIIAANGKVVAYMGDDERFEYVYKFVSRDRYDGSGTAAARAKNKRLLSNGDLFVARFTGDGLEDGVSDGTGVWLPLTKAGASVVPGMSIEEVLVYTRLAADTVMPTKMDRPEDVQPSLKTRRIYVACTNNSKRTATDIDEANPRPANKDGHIVEIIETNNANTAPTFRWNLLLICGDAASAGTYFGGYSGPVSPISCPDNLAFDSTGHLWISTDGQPGSIGLADALHHVALAGPERGRVRQFLAVPAGAETCGPVIHDKDGSVFVAVQHPGEDGSWEAPQSLFPDFVTPGSTPAAGKFAGPRPSIVQVTRR